MKIASLAFLFLLAHLVTGQEETCSAEGTCASSEENNNSNNDEDEGDVCFPDGECFESLDEAVWHYRQFTKTVELIVPKNYGQAQKVDASDPYAYEKILETLAATHEYMKELFQNDTAKDYRDQCKMNHNDCTFWASTGECDANPKYMRLQCAPACQTCDQVSFAHRCPFDRDAPKAWGPGDLNKMFERLTQDPYYVERFEPTIHSKPPEGPWVITLENVTTEEQCSKLIQLGADRGYTRSKDVGEVKFDGSFKSKVQETRTSDNTWCLDECYENEATQAVIKNMENITGIPDHNSEYLQLLRYEETQRYANHHDYIAFHNDRFQGARIITVFLYLNDVEEGGGTHFSSLGITVQPKVGRAVIWPSVLDHNPDAKDHRTNHEALPVIRGVKYGANAWVHQRSFKEVFEKGCA